jgi:hypothetical protein
LQEEVSECLERMTRAYTTEEQRRNHEGLETMALAPQATTFF